MTIKKTKKPAKTVAKKSVKAVTKKPVKAVAKTVAKKSTASTNVLTKSGLIDAVYKKHKLSKKAVEDIVQAVIDTMRSNLLKGVTIRIHGLYSLSTKRREARNGFNPTTGKHIKVPARLYPHARFSYSITEELNRNKKTNKTNKTSKSKKH